MKKKTWKKAAVVFLVLLALAGSLFSRTAVYAAEYGTGDVIFSLDIHPASDNFTLRDVTVNGDAWTGSDDRYRSENGAYEVKGIIESTDGSRPQFMAGGNVSAYMEGRSTIRPETEIEYSFTLSLDEIGTALDSDGNPINFIGLNLDAEEGGGLQGGAEAISFDMQVTDTHLNFAINGKTVVDDADGTLWDSFRGTIEEAGTTDPEQANELRLYTPFGDRPIKKFTINGVAYEEGHPDVRFEGEEGEAWVITVPGADTYVIRGEVDADAKLKRTIIWANVDADHTAEEFDEDMLLTHGRGKIIAVYDEKGNQTSGEVDVDPNTGMGWAVVDPGSSVVFEFVPEYGYQLTEVLANGFPLEPQDAINQYTFTMPDTNIHFAAVFTAIEDVVQAGSEKVSGGSIELGNTLAGGTAQLTVNDVEPGADKIAGFEAAAGDYSIVNYLDIDLYNVYYKGKADDSDVWSNKIDELTNESTIRLQLAEGVDADEIVIVHNLHDGEEYEIIPIDSYDPATNTITFKTRSFSSYAIATKKTSKKDSEKKDSEKKDSEKKDSAKKDSSKKTETVQTAVKSPKTGEGAAQDPWNALLAFAVLAIATGAGILFRNRAKR